MICTSSESRAGRGISLRIGHCGFASSAGFAGMRGRAIRTTRPPCFTSSTPRPRPSIALYGCSGMRGAPGQAQPRAHSAHRQHPGHSQPCPGVSARLPRRTAGTQVAAVDHRGLALDLRDCQYLRHGRPDRHRFRAGRLSRCSPPMRPTCSATAAWISKMCGACRRGPSATGCGRFPTPQARLECFEAFLAAAFRRRFMEPRPIRHCAVTYALQRFAYAPSIATVRDVARGTGWSERRFSQVFREEVGLTPKVWCRIQRFQRAVQQLHAGVDVPWAELALRLRLLRSIPLCQRVPGVFRRRCDDVFRPANCVGESYCDRRDGLRTSDFSKNDRRPLLHIGFAAEFESVKLAAQPRRLSCPFRQMHPHPASCPPTPNTSPSTIMPALRYRDAPAAIDWLCTGFGLCAPRRLRKPRRHHRPCRTHARRRHDHARFGEGRRIWPRVQVARRSRRC